MTILSQKARQKRRRTNPKMCFTSECAIQHMKAIEQLLAAEGRTAAEVSLLLGLASSTTCAYMRQLRAVGRARPLPPSQHRGAMVWVLGEDREFMSRDDIPVMRNAVKNWTPHHVRDALVAALFGAPPVHLHARAA